MKCTANVTLTLCVLRSGFSPTLFGSSSSAACVRCPQVWNARAFISVFVCVHEAGCGKSKWPFARGLSPSAQCPFFMGHRSHLSASLWRTSKFLLCPHLVLKNTPPLSNRPKQSAPALVYPNKSLQEWRSGVVRNNRMTLLWLLWRANTDKHLHRNKYSCYYSFYGIFRCFPGLWRSR